LREAVRQVMPAETGVPEELLAELRRIAAAARLGGTTR
jgi:hypothetical protein